jgi:hypothetical protein
MQTSPVGKSHPALRPEIEALAAGALLDGRWDDAIFAAFRFVEAQLQQRVASSLIGRALVAHAFDPTAPRVRISPNPDDVQPVADLFRGALGFLKGDRSHKEAPAVPCPDEETCVRGLALASYLLDLLDLDQNVAPQIRAVRADGVNALSLRRCVQVGRRRCSSTAQKFPSLRRRAMSFVFSLKLFRGR